MSISNSHIRKFQSLILLWYEKNGRHFPWRNKSATSYNRVISEALLQRTKAETVAKFFPSFIKKYPSWKILGNATQDELEKTLKPIGLHRQRASRLYKLAQEMKRRKGRFPTNRADVEKIPMMGQYITNAYELFVLNQPSPLLDTNMARVLERYFGPRKLADIRYDSYLQELSKKVVNHYKPKEVNWAILDFASLVCKNRNPLCKSCPINDSCVFYEKSIK